MTTPPSVIGQVRAGNLKALAFTGPKRHPSLPEVPTSAEAGMPSCQVESWFALFTPAGTSPEIIQKLTVAVKKIVDSDTYRKKLEDQGAFATYLDPQALDKLVAQELVTWRQVIKDNGIKAE